MSALSLPFEANIARLPEAEFRKKWGASEDFYLELFGASPEDLMYARVEYELERFGVDLDRKIQQWVGKEPDLFRGFDSKLLQRAALAVVVCEAHDLGYFSFHQILPDLNEAFYELCKSELKLYSNLLTAYYVGWTYKGTIYGLSARDSMEQVYAHMGRILRRLNFPDDSPEASLGDRRDPRAR
jgi:hypothetical protein